MPVDLLPVSYSGTVKTANHLCWLKALRAQEQDGGNGTGNDEIKEVIVECPRSYDVIFRKGPTYKNNPGNMNYRELVELTSDEHTKATRKGKYEITWRIVKNIEDQNGRFLEWSKSRELWIVVTDREKIRNKIAACYKHYNHKKLNNKKRAVAQQAVSQAD